jgi:pimeloyl-ACP methyl ester carboxylesterase
MKTKLLLSLLLLGTLLQANAQNVLPEMKSRPADFEYLSAPDSLGVRHELKMPNVYNKKAVVSQTKLPYPIIFIHGLNSGAATWNTFTDFMDSNYLLSYGGRFDISLNDDNDLFNANLNIWPNPAVGADIAFYQSTLNNDSDYYYVNFAVNSNGIYDQACTNLSNQSAIAKQGKALQRVIKEVRLLTGRDKVILMGYSMGGLAAREYLQNPGNWQLDGQHHVAKLVTTGTPHGGSNATATFLGSLFTNINERSEAIRDLRTSYTYSTNNGVYLFGGIESNNVMDDSLLGPFYNIDVNCNGITGENIIGLNGKTPQFNLDYSCIIGTGVNVGNTDGVVFTNNANINNVATFNSSYTNLTQNIFYSPVIHTNLPSQNYKNLQGLDEPNDFPLAYRIDFNKTYSAFISEQSQFCSYAPTDFDDYKFTVASNSNVLISINIPSSLNLKARIVSNDQLTQIGPIQNSNGASNFTFTQNNLSPGNYFLEIYGIPTNNTISGYNFSLSSTLSTDTFDRDNSIILFPNPTTSAVFFDNTKHEFTEVQVFNYLGQEVAREQLTGAVANQEINLSTLSAGVYVLKFHNGTSTATAKVVKQ